MRVVLRADAGREQGSGHVMRCLTLAEELVLRGHEVHLVSSVSGIPWLADVVEATPVTRHEAIPHLLDADSLLALAPDWVVVDSYQIDADAISALARDVPVLAIVDGDTRGIVATNYLDTNLGAERVSHGELDERMWAGAPFALVRRAILSSRRAQPWQIEGLPAVVAFMGGTDPGAVIVEVAERLASVERPFTLTIVAPEALHDRVREAFAGDLHLVATSPDLPEILAGADLVVAAAGTSAWDVAALGLPAVLVAVVDNQLPSLATIDAAGIALTVDAVTGSLDPVAADLDRLLASAELRESLSRAATALFDGRGPGRVVDALEARVAAMGQRPSTREPA